MISTTLLLLTPALAASAGAQEAEPAFSEAGAIAAIREYHGEWEELDFDAVAETHSPDFEYIFFSQVIEASAFPAILSDSWLVGVASYRIDESDFHAVLLQPDHAYVSVRFDDETVYEDSTIAHTSGMMSYLLAYDDGWKVRRLHHSGPLPEGLFEGTPAD
ncbi:hypothetical protein [Alteriqipengyuania lutimaris]|uniref:Nuclear transport factor 2 family protein n=1 Tax=Alteriqipengyuania lutimaris TaxID=1538146 RepID=A0A395LI28_9SPHN|nr:hypothetical protein [Alteriqipengyuania lutimaris]MBB3034601.1 ketosteroid isomerase-like protein [Alteriqipengyuania lutimaris]RDS76522.1 hypothetical protein DL238_02160 [Alteriqipengyuania lutimaris]